jgi:hypothetical protein
LYKDEQAYRRTDKLFLSFFFLKISVYLDRDKRTDGQTDGQTNRHTDGQTDGRNGQTLFFLSFFQWLHDLTNLFSNQCRFLNNI